MLNKENKLRIQLLEGKSQIKISYRKEIRNRMQNHEKW